MAASAWQLYDRAKHRICNNEIQLSTSGFRMALYKGSAAASISVSAVSLQGQIGSEASGGGYPAGGTALGQVRWTTGTSAGQQKWYHSANAIFTAVGTDIGSVQYAMIVFSAGATSGYALCWSKLSTSPFDVTAGNTLTISPNASGVFTLAG